MDALTTVALRKTTVSKLRVFREYPRESYDETVNKLISIASMSRADSEGELTPDARRGIEEGMRQMKEGKGMSTKELMKKLGLE